MIGTVTWPARGFAFALGMGLCLWTLTKLRKRTLLVSICSFFITVGLGLILFSIIPTFFDQLAYSLGVQYPPVAYLIAVILLLMVIIVFLASKISSIDERCRRLAQELALLPKARTSAQEQNITGNEG